MAQITTTSTKMSKEGQAMMRSRCEPDKYRKGTVVEFRKGGTLAGTRAVVVRQYPSGMLVVQKTGQRGGKLGPNVSMYSIGEKFSASPKEVFYIGEPIHMHRCRFPYTSGIRTNPPPLPLPSPINGAPLPVARRRRPSQHNMRLLLAMLDGQPAGGPQVSPPHVEHLPACPHPRRACQCGATALQGRLDACLDTLRAECGMPAVRRPARRAEAPRRRTAKP